MLEEELSGRLHSRLEVSAVGHLSSGLGKGQAAKLGTIAQYCDKHLLINLN